jgi:hypothetical protein
MDGLAGGDWLKVTGWRDIVLLWRLLGVIPVEVVLAFDTSSALKDSVGSKRCEAPSDRCLDSEPAVKLAMRAVASTCAQSDS